MAPNVKKMIISAAVILACLWVLTGVIDFARVHSFELPIFCVW